MRISGFTTTRPEMASTRTYHDFSQFLGRRSAEIKPCELLEPLQTYIINKNWR